MNTEEKERQRRLFLEKSVPEKRRIMLGRAFSAELSPRAAIKANCFVCSGMDAEEAKKCAVILCPLYEYNGYRLGAEQETAPPAGYTADELERDNPHNAWMHENGPQTEAA
jgi:hypothetical protein